MYTLILVLSIIAVVLSPIAVDWFLYIREAQLERRAWRARQKKDPQVVWASPRGGTAFKIAAELIPSEQISSAAPSVR